MTVTPQVLLKTTQTSISLDESWTIANSIAAANGFTNVMDTPQNPAQAADLMVGLGLELLTDKPAEVEAANTLFSLALTQAPNNFEARERLTSNILEGRGVDAADRDVAKTLIESAPDVPDDIDPAILTMWNSVREKLDGNDAPAAPRIISPRDHAPDEGQPLIIIKPEDRLNTLLSEKQTPQTFVDISNLTLDRETIRTHAERIIKTTVGETHTFDENEFFGRMANDGLHLLRNVDLDLVSDKDLSTALSYIAHEIATDPEFTLDAMHLNAIALSVDTSNAIARAYLIKPMTSTFGFKESRNAISSLLKPVGENPQLAAQLPPEQIGELGETLQFVETQSTAFAASNTRRRNWIIGSSVGGAVLAAAIGIGSYIGLNSGADKPNPPGGQESAVVQNDGKRPAPTPTPTGTPVDTSKMSEPAKQLFAAIQAGTPAAVSSDANIARCSVRIVKRDGKGDNVVAMPLNALEGLSADEVKQVFTIASIKLKVDQALPLTFLQSCADNVNIRYPDIPHAGRLTTDARAVQTDSRRETFWSTGPDALDIEGVDDFRL